MILTDSFQRKGNSPDSSPLVSFFHSHQTRLSALYPKDSNKWKKYIGWAQQYTETYIQSREHRSKDVNSKEIKLARELAIDFIGKKNHHFVVDCMDGRNLPAIMLSHVPHVGGVMRTQAGEMFSIQPPYRDGDTIKILPDSYKINSVRYILKKNKKHTIHYSLDSHLGCAARKEINPDSDGGLKADILRKMVIAKGLLQIRNELAERDPEIATLSPQFFSYDPTSGIIYMGLEAHVDSETGFTPEVLGRLVDGGKIICTRTYLDDPTVQRVLSRVVKQADFRFRYKQSMLSNWQSITELYDGGKGVFYVRILSDMTTAYKKSGWIVGDTDNISDHKISRDVLKNKARVMLKNLVTRWSIAQGDFVTAWPYTKHPEQGWVYTEGDYAPYETIDLFTIFSRVDPFILLKDSYLCEKLVRAFRRAGSIRDPLNVLSQEDFVDAPIVVFNNAILRSFKTQEDWVALEKIPLLEFFQSLDWDDVSSQGIYYWNRDVFRSKIRSVVNECNYKFTPEQLEEYYDSLYGIFDRFRLLSSDMANGFIELLQKGKVIIVSMLFDIERTPRILVPITL